MHDLMKKVTSTTRWRISYFLVSSSSQISHSACFWSRGSPSETIGFIQYGSLVSNSRFMLQETGVIRLSTGLPFIVLLGITFYFSLSVFLYYSCYVTMVTLGVVTSHQVLYDSNEDKIETISLMLL